VLNYDANGTLDKICKQFDERQNELNNTWKMKRLKSMLLKEVDMKYNKLVMIFTFVILRDTCYIFYNENNKNNSRLLC